MHSPVGPRTGGGAGDPATLKKGARVDAAGPMEIRVLEKESDFLKVEIPQGEETVLIPLVEALEAEEKVVEARYIIGHPFLDKPILLLRTKGERPQQVLKRVLKDLADLYGDALQDFDKKSEKIKA